MVKRLAQLAKCLQIGGKNLVLGANLASLRFWAQPECAYRYWNACLFLRDAMKGRALPITNIWDAFPDLPTDPEVRFPALDQSWPWVDPSYLADLVHLGLLCKAIYPRTIFEIGTSIGYSSLFLAVNSPPGVKVWTLDLPTGDSDRAKHSLTRMDEMVVRDCHKREPCFVGYKVRGEVRRLYGDSADFDFSPYWKSIDLFFIDGAHTYDYVRADTLSALRCCHQGSVIAWHDYGRSGLSYGVTKWLNEFDKVVPISSTPGSSVAFMSCATDPEEILGMLGVPSQGQRDPSEETVR
jgi:methyltransferase family protein